VVFEVIPAIDLVGGRLGHLRDCRLVPVNAFGSDPMGAAAAFVEAGARWIHVVDTDLAFTGRPAGLDTIRRIAGMPVRVQASGGLGTENEIAAVLEAGAARAVLGSAALGDLDNAARLLARHGERLAVGLEVDGDVIRPRGRGDGAWPLAEVLPRLAASEATRFVVTAVTRVGERSGPDLRPIRVVAKATGRPVIAAGGIATLDDLRAVALAAASVEGAIVGSALYEGGLDLAEAIRSLGAVEGA
jgi:phosphoribosylformimino-5-aminoimidazole carboxamide ribonucleotide (ProFAR) isomerase